MIVSNTKKYNIVIEDSKTFTDKVWLFEFSKGTKESCEITNVSHTLLEVIHKKLSEGNSVVPIGLGTSKKRDDENIIYRPYESFTRSNEWMAGRYVGEASFKLTKEDFAQYKLKAQELRNFIQESILLSIKPRFGTPFLCHMLEEIYNFKMPESAMQHGEGVAWNKFYQLILRQLWIAKFAKADKYGLPRQTVKRSHQGMQIRGHLNVRKSILPFFTKKEVVSEYREKEVDDMIGRIVYKAYDILADKETGLRNLPPQVQESINDLYSRYHGEQIKITEHDYQSIRYKSIYVSWKPLVDFSWQIIKHRGYNPEQSIDEQGYGLFFDMAEIWEAYIGKLLEKDFMHCTERNSNIRLFENEEEKQFQRIIPDYLSRDWTNEKAKAVGDAKYMNLAGKEILQGEQTYSVYYKTIMYMYRFNSQKGFVFYPMNPDESENKELVEPFTIGGEKNGQFYKVGLRLPKNDDKDYVNKLKVAEGEFQEAASNILKNLKSQP